MKRLWIVLAVLACACAPTRDEDDGTGTEPPGTPDAGLPPVLADSCADGKFSLDGRCFGAEDPTSHVAEDVCAVWKAGHRTDAAAKFTPGSGACAAGALSPEARRDVRRRVDAFRWLAGLSPVAEDPRMDVETAACAAIAANNPVGLQAHHPEPSATCYTEDGAAAAGKSNIYWTSVTRPDLAAGSIDGYVEDTGNETTLGHRRWILYPKLGAIGVGYFVAGKTSDASCLEVFDTSGTGRKPAWYAFPPPGPVPDAVMRWPWSFHAPNLKPAQAQVAVSLDGAPLAVQRMPIANGYGDPAIAWTPDGWTPESGKTYDVAISGGGVEATYAVSFVSCP